MHGSAIHSCTNAVIYYKPQSGKETKPGDSGSALLHEGKLVGMHFGSTRDGQNKLSVAMSAQDIFQQSVFSREIELVSDHNI